MTPEDEQHIMQLLAENAPAAGPLREVVQNILDEPVPQRVKERLSKPLLPAKKINQSRLQGRKRK